MIDIMQKYNKNHIIWQIEVGRCCSSLKRSLSELKQSSSVMKN